MPNQGGGRIAAARARRMITHYRQARLGQALPKNDTQSVWFAASVVAEALGISLPDNHPTSGLRFYLAAYDADTHPEGQPELSGRLTLVMAPTRQEGELQVSGLMEEEAFNEGALCPPFCADDSD